MVLCRVRQHKMHNQLTKKDKEEPYPLPSNLDDFRRHLEEMLKRAINQVSIMIYEVSLADMNRLTKARDSVRLRLHDLEERIKQLEEKNKTG